MQAYGRLGKTLEKIKSVSTPDRFTTDFLTTKLAMKGGSVKPVIPFLKRTGFLGSDGTPTNLYNQFRNAAQSGAAAAEALRIGYAALYESNEYTHELNDTELTGLIIQVTGMTEESKSTKAVVGSFKTLRGFADFSTPSSVAAAKDSDTGKDEPMPEGTLPTGINLGYTINIHLPATSDIAVFNAIFKSLRENMLQ